MKLVMNIISNITTAGTSKSISLMEERDFVFLLRTSIWSHTVGALYKHDKFVSVVADLNIPLKASGTLNGFEELLSTSKMASANGCIELIYVGKTYPAV
jgi:hypothetical protein